LVAEMDFGIWKYMFSPVQYMQTKQSLLSIFPNKPRSSRQMQYNQSYIFNEIDKINSLRNRIAHHEPICFITGTNTYSTKYALYVYNKILCLLDWMDIDATKYLYGIDHVKQVCSKIDNL
jgi:trehalose-6-phosphate synthase